MPPSKLQVLTSPDNHDLRTHLAELLAANHRHADALQQASTVLAALPDHIAALEVAARAASALGDSDKAKRYGRLLAALKGTAPEAPAPPGDDEEAEEPPATEKKVLAMKVIKGGTADEEWRVEKSDVKLADVAGLTSVKRRLELSLFAQLRHNEMAKYYGRSIRGGLLLFGPPGCGKTYVARATAGELGAHFVSIGLNDVLDMYIGQSERKLHELFELARRNAPAVLFIDEIDALGRKRSLQRESHGRDIVNQLLSEMDGLAANNDGLFVMAATNHPWDVDSALSRPGRFDRVVFVPPPDAASRQAILTFHMRERVSEAVDLKLIAARTEGFSGADLAHLCDTAAEQAMEDAMDTGKVRPIQHKDFVAALNEVRPSTRVWLETAKDYALFANEGGAYNDLLDYLRSVRLL